MHFPKANLFTIMKESGEIMLGNSFVRSFKTIYVLLARKLLLDKDKETELVVMLYLDLVIVLLQFLNVMQLKFCHK